MRSDRRLATLTAVTRPDCCAFENRAVVWPAALCYRLLYKPTAQVNSSVVVSLVSEKVVGSSTEICFFLLSCSHFLRRIVQCNTVQSIQYSTVNTVHTTVQSIQYSIFRYFSYYVHCIERKISISMLKKPYRYDQSLKRYNDIK